MLSKVVNSTPSASGIQPNGFVKAAILAASDELVKATKEIEKFMFEKPGEKAAYDDCKKLFEDAMEELKSSISHADRLETKKNDVRSKFHNLRTWLSAVISYQETCVDGFAEGELEKKMRKAL
ncbi:hypothetical protein Nepgr_025147 [Nepenthes gracilis]|uniref:Pectinesterase inhibitor domain-containing protein n=1 Tax=Nepenthes gracilis TaxID=150966 RepID=A0AAD3T5Q0_NEPGR|nr:hypothetical protein Nepgr_025147 [Nepenthes gracilis]